MLLDDNCKPLRPAKLWCDVEATEESKWIRILFGNDGNLIMCSQDYLAQGTWTMKHEVCQGTWTMKNEQHTWNQVPTRLCQFGTT